MKLDELEKIVIGATPGPWQFKFGTVVANDDPANRINPSYDTGIYAGGNTDNQVLISWDYEGYSSGIEIRERDAAFIMAARLKMQPLIDVARVANELFESVILKNDTEVAFPTAAAVKLSEVLTILEQR